MDLSKYKDLQNRLKKSLNDEKYDEAINILRTFQLKINSAPEISCALAILFELNEQIVSAYELLKQVKTYFKGDRDYLLDFARIAGELAHFGEAKKLQNLIINKFSNSINEIDYLRAVGYLGREFDLKIIDCCINNRINNDKLIKTKIEHFIALKKEKIALKLINTRNIDPDDFELQFLKIIASFLDKNLILDDYSISTRLLSQNTRFWLEKLILLQSYDDVVYSKQKGLFQNGCPYQNYNNELVLKKVIQTVDGWLSPSECKFLNVIAPYSPDSGAIVEIGSWKGRSTLCLGLAVKGKRKNSIISIDPHQWSDSSSKFSTYDDFQNNIKRFSLEKDIQSIKKKSVEAVKNWKKPIALLFIDGSHSYKDVKVDLTMWLPYCIPNSLILMHDITYPGVFKATQELLMFSQDYHLVNFLDNTVVFQKIAKLNGFTPYELAIWSFLSYEQDNFTRYINEKKNFLKKLVVHWFSKTYDTPLL